MHNVIRRSTTVIFYRQLVNTTAGAAGDLMKAVKEPNISGWTCTNVTTGAGVKYHQFIDNLRNENITKIITQY